MQVTGKSDYVQRSHMLRVSPDSVDGDQDTNWGRILPQMPQPATTLSKTCRMGPWRWGEAGTRIATLGLGTRQRTPVGTNGWSLL
ncbi:hypothetical protein chiPu_0021646 [Chiloscyllium punctatum]|uniref:Uncharacterized protein n=1 Tax=Chiloscyllium punctatum TaxID=137246 RepID=A0A401RJF3_CHIPU|nr:hypothetical protein [Chiloscyllium punctatum]